MAFLPAISSFVTEAKPIFEGLMSACQSMSAGKGAGGSVLSRIFDQAVVRDRESGYDNTYFAGAGLSSSLNGPWQNSLLRFEFGVPVVGHGVKGFVANVVLLKLF